METENKELEKKKMMSRKDRIKTIAIIFLVFMLILTFFSNTIMNWSLVQVSTEAVISDILTNKVRGTGTVEAGQVYDVSIKESRRIQTMYVKTDQQVSTGDILFTLAQTDSEELKTAKEELATAKTGYETNVLAAGITVDERLDIEKGQAGSLSDRQTKLVAAKNAVESATDNLNYIQNLVNEATAEGDGSEGTGTDVTVDDLQDQLEIKVVEKTLAELQPDYDKAKKGLEDAQAKVDELQKNYEALQKAYNEQEKLVNAKKKEIAKIEAKINLAKTTGKATPEQIKKAKEAVEEEELFLQIKEAEYKDYIDNVLGGEENLLDEGCRTKYRNINKIKQNIEELKETYNTLKDSSTNYEGKLEKLQEDLDVAKEQLSDLQIDLGQANTDLTEAGAELTKATDTLTTANNDFKKINKTYSKLSDKKSEIAYNSDIRKLQAQIDALKKTNGNKAEYLRSLQLKLTQATALKAEKEKDLTELQDFLAKQISLATEFKNIKKLKKKVKDLKEKTSEFEIKAPVSGIITAINLTAGQTITPDESIIQIQPENEDFIVSIDINAAQARRINPSDEVTILNNWSANSISARVDSIRPSKTDKTMNTVRIKLLGDVKVGDSYTFSIGTSSNSYDYIVPTSAIKEDSNGKFVLTITSKSTPLGNRYYATRTDIEVLASDDTKSAVSGQFDENPYVITTTTKPVEAGQQVRLAE